MADTEDIPGADVSFAVQGKTVNAAVTAVTCSTCPGSARGTRMYDIITALPSVQCELLHY